MQWFDLKDHGAKLERSQEPKGAYFMRLTFDEPCDANAIINSALEGWVATEARPGTEFRNYREFSKTSSIVAALEPFFDRDQLIMAKVDASKLRQGEELRGYTNPIGADLAQSLYPQRSAVAQDLVRLLDSEKRERILSRVAAAQEIMGTSPGVVAFDGRAVEVWHKLARHFGYHDATAAMSATFHRAKSAGEAFSEIHDALMKASETGSSLPKLNENLGADRTGLLIAEHLQHRSQLHADSALGWDDAYFYRGFVRHVEAHFAVWDHKAVGEPLDDPESYSSKFVADPAMPGSWKTGLFYRASKAIEQSAEMLGVTPRDLFADRTIFHLGKRLGQGEALGYHRTYRPKVAGETVDMRTIKFGPHVAGVMVHEMGHAVDYSHRPHLKVEDAVAILIDETGIRSFVTEQIDADDNIDGGHRAYLKQPEEIIARTFEAALADHQRQAGDRDFAQAGGVVALNGGFDHAPPSELTGKFVKGMREIMMLTRDYRLEAEEEKRAGAAISM